MGGLIPGEASVAPTRRAPRLGSVGVPEGLAGRDASKRGTVDQTLSIGRLLVRQAAEWPDAEAIAAPGRQALRYAQLCESVGETVGVLRALGVEPGDCVALALPDGPETAVAFLAASCAAACAPLNPAYREGEFGFYLADLRPRALIVPSNGASAAATVARARGIPVIELEPALKGPAGRFRLLGAPGSVWSSSLVEACSPAETALLLHTSGTTARPKLVPLTHHNLCISAGQIAASLELSPEDRCLDLMPLFHVHGLVGGLLASLAGGGTVVCPPGFVATQFFAWLEDTRPSWYTAVPTMHQAVLARAGAAGDVLARYPQRFARSSSAPLSPPLMAALEGALQAPVIEAYGMTESAHQIASNPLPPRDRRAGTVGLPTGTRVAIVNDDWEPLAAGEQGEIVIAGAAVTRGYEHDPEANAAAFRGEWFRTGDQGSIDPDGYLRITGRLKELINRGGEKISPLEVDEALSAHPAVAEAVTFALPHPRLGEEVAAAVVLRAGAEAGERELREHAAARLAPFKVPSRVVFLEEIPHGPTGKPQRISLAVLLAEQQAPRKSYAASPAPRRAPDALEAWVAARWAETLAVPEVGLEDDFFTLGGDSVLAAALLNRLRAGLDVELGFVDLTDRPTVAGLAARIRARQESGTRALPLARRPQPGTSLPLSWAQERLWFLHQLDPDDSAYNSHLALRLRGPLSLIALSRSLETLVERHATLRTEFLTVDGCPAQRDLPRFRLPFSQRDLLVAMGEEREREAVRVAQEFVRAPFDFAAGPPIRAQLLRLDQHDHLLVLAMHHLVTDGWSMGILGEEFARCYGASATGEAPALRALSLAYGDHVLRQRAQEGGEDLNGRLDWWREYLEGAPFGIDLPTDRPRRSAGRSVGGEEHLTLPAALSLRLRKLARGAGATPFHLLLAAFGVLLGRLSGQEEVVVGSPATSRVGSDLEGIVGLFVNTLPLRVDLRGAPSFRQVLERVRGGALAALGRQEAPLERLLSDGPWRTAGEDQGRLQVTFQLRNLPPRCLEAGQLQVEELPLTTGSSQFDLSLVAEERSEGIRCQAEYNRQLFDSATIRSLLSRYRMILAGAAADPDCPVSRIPILTHEERDRVLVQWNQTRVVQPAETCLHRRVERQSELSPDVVAVQADAGCLTYRQFDGLANRVARRLVRMGVRRGDVVGVCLERSLALPVAALGILKAGAAFLPLDPADSRTRLAGLLDEAAAAVVVSREAASPAISGPPLLLLDDAWQSLSGESAADPALPPLASLVTAPDDLAYVIFTSGSTGQPKGVMVEHQAIGNHMEWMQRRFPLTPDDRVLQKTPLTFDPSIWEIFAPLQAGARLVMARPGGHLDPAYLVRTVRDSGITVLQVVPSLLRLLVEEPGFEECVTLRAVFCGGEALPVELAHRFGARLRAPLYNLYGPTEAAIDATCGQWRSGHDGPTVPIGRPIDNLRAYVLDPIGQPVPPGVAGELYLGGAGLARGYLNRPELTAEKFVPGLFDGGPGGRLFRTGDRVRWLADGQLEYLGRLDHQLKLRGCRIEPGEVEAALARHPAVREAAVAVREFPPGEHVLAGYVVTDSASVPSLAELREFLRGALPGPLLPAVVMHLHALPRTRSGKLDREALPPPTARAPAGAARGLRPSFELPRTEVEAVVARVYSEVLGGGPVGARDDFFALGGHSLMAARVMARLRAAFPLELPLRTLFESPTVAGLAAAVDRAIAEASSGLEQLLSEVEQGPDDPGPVRLVQER